MGTQGRKHLRDRVGRAVILAGAGLLAAPRADAQVGESPFLATQTKDLDSDGKPDVVVLFASGALEVRWGDGTKRLLAGPAGLVLTQPAELALGLGPAGQLWRAGARLPNGGAWSRWVEQHKRDVDSVYAGPTGPVGRDGEYAVHLELQAGELFRFQTTPTVQRCDGEHRLFTRRWQGGAWHDAAAATLPPLAQRIAGPRPPPPGPAGLGTARPALWSAASVSTAAKVEQADALVAPKELEDDVLTTGWSPGADALGSYITLSNPGPSQRVVAVRLRALPGRGLPRRIGLLAGRGSWVEFELDATRADQWLVPAAPIETRCLSVLIVEPGPRPVGLAELDVYSELDGPDVQTRLMAIVTQSTGEPVRLARQALQRLAARGAEPRRSVLAAAVQTLDHLAEPARAAVEDLLFSLGLHRPEDAAVLVALLEKGSITGSHQAELVRRVAGLGQVGREALGRAGQGGHLQEPARAAWLRALGTVGGDEVGAVLLDTLADEALREPLRSAAIEGLAAWLRCTDETSPRQRWLDERVRSTAGAWQPQRLLGLVQSLKGAATACPEPARRTAAQNLAGLWTETQALPADAHWLVRYRLLEALQALAVDEARSAALLQSLVSSRDGEDEILRRQAVQALAARGQAAQTMSALSHADPGLRLAALRGLALAPAASVSPALRAALDALILREKWPQVKRLAIEQWASQCGPQDSRGSDAIRAAMRDEKSEVARAAVLAVGKCEGGNALGLLADLAKSQGSPGEVRGLACATRVQLGKAGGQARWSVQEAAEVLGDLLLQGTESAAEQGAFGVLTCLRALEHHGRDVDVEAVFPVLEPAAALPLRAAAVRAVAAICKRGKLASTPANDKIRRLLQDKLDQVTGLTEPRLVRERDRAREACR